MESNLDAIGWNRRVYGSACGPSTIELGRREPCLIPAARSFCLVGGSDKADIRQIPFGTRIHCNHTSCQPGPAAGFLRACASGAKQTTVAKPRERQNAQHRIGRCRRTISSGIRHIVPDDVVLSIDRVFRNLLPMRLVSCSVVQFGPGTDIKS